MAKLDLGAKLICPSCGTKSYDFGKKDKTCPSCGTDPRQEVDKRRRQSPSFAGV